MALYLVYLFLYYIGIYIEFYIRVLFEAFYYINEQWLIRLLPIDMRTYLIVLMILVHYQIILYKAIWFLSVYRCSTI